MKHLPIELLERYALREVSGREQQRVERHVTCCAECLDRLQGEVGWVTRGEFLTILAKIDSLHLEIEKLWREKMPESTRTIEVNKRESQIRTLAEQLGRDVRIFSVPGGLARDTTRPGTSFCPDGPTPPTARSPRCCHSADATSAGHACALPL